MPASPDPIYSIKGTDFYSLIGYEGRVLKPLSEGSTCCGWAATGFGGCGTSKAERPEDGNVGGSIRWEAATLCWEDG